MRSAKRYFILIPFLLLCLLVFCCVCSAESGDVLMYMIGSDLETEQAAATHDLHEMIHALGLYTEKSVVAFLSGSEKWWLPGLEDGHSYTLKIQSDGYEILQDHGLFSGTTESALAEFIQQYASDGDDLIFWGHGAPGAAGIGRDLLFHLDTLTLYEIQAALEKSKVHFRVIGFDACSMATLQSAWMLNTYCDLFCASMVDEQIHGWSYNAVIPLLLGHEGITASLLQTGFRESGITVLDMQELRSCQELLSDALNRSSCGSEIKMLSDILILKEDDQMIRMLSDSDLLITHWPPGELQTEELLPGIGNIYRAFLTRR